MTDCGGGVIVRTDFSDEAAWQSFCVRLKQAEAEMSEAGQASDSPELEAEAPAEASSSADAEDVDMESDSSEDEDDTTDVLIKVINPTVPEEQAIFQNISNLSALRLLNDIDVRPAPSPPPGTKRITPQNTLIDQGGWQEIYSGLNIWIYDAISNSDSCLRLVSQAGDLSLYGTAT